jgi:hypothetical protein
MGGIIRTPSTWPNFSPNGGSDLEATFYLPGNYAGYGFTGTMGKTADGRSTLLIGLNQLNSTVGNASQLTAALNRVDGTGRYISGAYNVQFTGDVGGFADPINLGSFAVNASESVTVDGAGHALDGAGGSQGFVINSGTLTIKNLTIVNATSPSRPGGALEIGAGANIEFDNGSISGGSGSPGVAGTGIDIGSGGLLTLAPTAGAVSTIADSIGGAGAVNINGPGEVDLTALNGFSGGLNIGGGTVVLASIGAAGAGPVSISGGTVNLAAVGVFSHASSISITGGFVSATAAGVFNPLAPITVSGGTLELSAAASNSVGPIKLGGTGTLVLDQGATGLASVTLGGGGKLLLEPGAVVGSVLGLSNTAQLDFAGVAPTGLAITRNGTDLVIDGTHLQGVTNAVMVADATGGTLVYVPVTQFDVASETDLNAALTAINAGGNDAAPNTNYVINLTGDVSLNTALTAIALPTGSTLTINGNGDTIDGSGTQHGLQVLQGALTLNQINLNHLAASSSAGDSFGGGALYVGGNGRVSLNSVSTANDIADTVGSDIAVAAGGSLSVSSASFGAPAPSLNIIDVASGGALTLAPHAGDVVSVTGPINAAPVIGNGTAVLSVASTFDGTTDVAGTLELAADGAAGTSGIALSSGATLKLDAGVTHLANTVPGLGSGGSIDFAALANATATLVGSTLTVGNGTQSQPRRDQPRSRRSHLHERWRQRDDCQLWAAEFWLDHDVRRGFLSDRARRAVRSDRTRRHSQPVA